MEMEGESGVMQQQTKDCRGLLGGARKHPSLELSKGAGSY